MNRPEIMKQIGILAILTFSMPIVTAQPSGGPYGPLPRNYELPKVEGKIYYVSPEGDSTATGASIEDPASIEAAFRRVTSGDAIVLRGGTYRTGNLLLNRGITLQPYGNEVPVLKGTFEATGWTDLGNGLWTTGWDRFFPSEPQDWWRYDREGRKTPLHRFNDDMVFVDGKFLQSAGWQGEVDENSFFIDYERGKVYIGTDPTNKLVEITAFNVAIHRITGEVNGKPSDKKGPVIRGITFTQYAYRAIEIDGTDPEGLSDEKNHGKEVTGTLIEHCEISYCSRVAGYFRGDNMVFRHCKISHTSTEGLYILSSNDVLLEKNIFTKNNIENITGYYPAAVKIFNQCYRVTCRDNLVIDHPNSNGIWYDVGNVDGVFVNNRVERVGSGEGEGRTDQLWPSQNGFFFEISKGAICAGNVFVDCDHGILILNSSDVHMYQNTFINSSACIGRNQRSAAGDHFGWHPATGPDVGERDGHVFVNNLLSAGEDFKRPLLFVWQPPVICEQVTGSPLKQLDYNVYIRQTHKRNIPLILWSPAANDKCQIALDSPAGLRDLDPKFAVHSKFQEDTKYSPFVSRELGNYRLPEGTAKGFAASKLPATIVPLLGITRNTGSYIGAYP